MKTRNRFAAALTCATALAVPAGADAATFRVDDNRADCPTAEFQSIQQAVLAAAPGDVIKVCRGTYPEHVIVPKPLTILGARVGNGQAPGRQTNPENESIVVNGGQGGFEIVANDVRVEGFTVQGNPAAASYPNAGIYVRTGSNRRIESNILRDNGLGVYLEGTQANLDVERNAFLDNRRTPNPSFIPAGGLFAAGGPLNETDLTNNAFSGNAQFSMNIGNGSDAGLRIEHNEAFDEGTFLIIGRSTDARVAYNQIDDIRGSGVFGFGDNLRMVIEHNDFDTGGGSAVRFTGPQFGTTGPNRDAVVQYNRARAWAFDGYSFNNTVGLTLQHNKADANANSGIRLQNADAGVILRNDTRDNGLNGVRAESQSTGNRIERNTALDNPVDCFDDSAGPGTGGTANLWIDNIGLTDNRGGALCMRDRS
jgi:parallel beta-helix repeat protein